MLTTVAAMGTSVGMSFFSHSIYGGGGPGLFHGNHVVTKHSKGIRHTRHRCWMRARCWYPEVLAGGNILDLVKDVFGDIPEFKRPLKAVGKEAKKIKELRWLDARYPNPRSSPIA